jgi:hypothetical protein
MGKVYGREPAMWLALLGALWQVVSAFGLDFDAQTQAIVTAVVAAVLGVIVAVQVHDGIVSAVNGLVVAAVSAVSYWCLHWDAEGQAKLVGGHLQLVARQGVPSQTMEPGKCPPGCSSPA